MNPWAMFTVLFLIHRSSEKVAFDWIAARVRGGVPEDLILRQCVASGALAWVQGEARRWTPTRFVFRDGKMEVIP